ncbi:perilipin-3-like isoform X1 [Gymnogyps californianus]|uniref:perilipin-3-like isoform X1 n=1 Tax=Gymnogyps californianus TaxID=33616 RepID=UPI0021C78224|nr:perilipin-3-like isoform X1 [Gymnogyps californianus]
MASEKSTKKDLLKAEEQQQASAVNRVTSLPLLNSAFNLVSSAYNYTKETHPYLSGVCSVAETVAAVAVGSVVGGAQPILNQLEPQIALVNEYACKGLDQLEENLPFLQQPADKVISDTKQLVSTKVTSAMDAACEAKEAMADKVTEAVDLTKNVVGDSVKLTRSMVASTVNSAVEAAQGAKDLVTNKVTEAVDRSKHIVEDSVGLTKSAIASTIVNAVEAAQGAKDLVTNKVTEAVDLSKHIVEDSVGLTKSAVASTIVNAVEAAQGAKDLVTNKVTEAVDLSKHIVEDSVGLTKSAIASTIVNAVEAAQGAKDLVTNKVTEAVDLSKHIVEDSVGLTKSAVASTITAAVGAAQGAKDLVTNKVTEAVDLTKGAVQDGVEKTKSVVTSTVNTALDAAYGTITSKINTALEQSREAIQEGVEMTNSVVTNSISKAKAVSQAVAGGVESVLGISEDLVDHYLPMTEEELGKLATTVEGFGMASVEEQKQQQSYFVRLGSLSNKVRHRAYQLSLNKLQRIKQSTQDTLSRLQLAIKLIESVKQEVGQKLLDGQEKLHQLWVDWSLTQPKGNQVKTASQAEQVESRTLAMLHIITQQLQPVYENLKASIQGLPSNIQEAVYQAARNIHKLHSSFSSAMSFQDLSRTTLTQSQDCVVEARRSLDDLFEYVTQNTPLNWLVGPFRAIAKVSQDSRKQKKGVVTDTKSCVLEKASSSKEVVKTPEEPKGANRIPGEGCEVLEKLEEKAEKDTEVALAAKEIKTNAPEEDL